MAKTCNSRDQHKKCLKNCRIEPMLTEYVTEDNHRFVVMVDLCCLLNKDNRKGNLHLLSKDQHKSNLHHLSKGQHRGNPSLFQKEYSQGNQQLPSKEQNKLQSLLPSQLHKSSSQCKRKYRDHSL